jgi:hypothetical protein
VIVSASRGQYLKPGSYEPGFFSHYEIPAKATSLLPVQATKQSMFRLKAYGFAALRLRSVDRIRITPHHRTMITKSCSATSSKKAPHPGASERRAR